MNSRDLTILRDLVRRYVDVCADPVQTERRNLWRQLNSLRKTRPLIYVRAFAWSEMPDAANQCEDPFLQSFETDLRRKLFWASLSDDSVFEPWLTLNASLVTPPDGVWGLPVHWHRSGFDRGSGVWDAPLKEERDIERMVVPHHEVNEEDTAHRLGRITEAVGDLITIGVDRAPAWRTWNGDISTQLVYLRGLQQVMLDMIDRPAWLHELLTFMRDGILKSHREAEEAGDWTLIAHQNQAMPYAEELAGPTPDSKRVTRKDLWYFAASQETTLVGPAMFDEFMFQYQTPIIEQFGLVAYGCCEDLTHKVAILKQVPSIRRIAVAPAMDVAVCAQRIGSEYVMSYRPNPAEMVSCGFDPDHVRTVVRRDLEACRDLHVDITLKDVETVEGDPDRVRRWTAIVREVIDDMSG